eukprot:6199531-Pleurochrysis_carterae.AAC.5
MDKTWSSMLPRRFKEHVVTGEMAGRARLSLGIGGFPSVAERAPERIRESARSADDARPHLADRACRRPS